MLKFLSAMVIGAILIAIADAAMGIHMGLGPRIVHQTLTMLLGALLFHLAGDE